MIMWSGARTVFSSLSVAQWEGYVGVGEGGASPGFGKAR